MNTCAVSCLPTILVNEARHHLLIALLHSTVYLWFFYVAQVGLSNIPDYTNISMEQNSGGPNILLFFEWQCIYF